MRKVRGGGGGGGGVIQFKLLTLERSGRVPRNLVY